MSAINPASFQTPTSSLGLTPAFGNPGFGTPASETPRRPAYNAGTGMGYQYEDARSVSRSGMPPPFYPQYQASPGMGQGMGQRMGAGMTSYGANMQPPVDPFSAYPTPNFGMFGQGQSFSRPDVRGHGQSPNPHQNMISDFQGMSLS